MEKIKPGKYVEITYDLYQVNADGSETLVHQVDPEDPEKFIFGVTPGMIEPLETEHGMVHPGDCRQSARWRPGVILRLTGREPQCNRKVDLPFPKLEKELDRLHRQENRQRQSPHRHGSLRILPPADGAHR